VQDLVSDDHLARFVVGLESNLDLGGKSNRSERGQPPFDPALSRHIGSRRPRATLFVFGRFSKTEELA